MVGLMSTHPKIDFKKTLKHLYAPSSREFSVVEVPAMQYLMVDGLGAPGGEAYSQAVEWLYAVSYPIKFRSKLELGRDYVVPPLEGLWWADDMDVFVTDDRAKWQWTMMIMQPEWISESMFTDAATKAVKKLGDPPETMRLAELVEGTSVQILHLGPFADEAPTIARLHNEFLPDNGFTENGHHHEIYLSDPRKTAPEKLRTILRQPVRRSDERSDRRFGK